MAQGKEEFVLAAAEVLTITADGVISTDTHGRILYFSPAAERMFGYSSEEVMRQSIGILIPDRFRDVHHTELAGFASETEGQHRLMGTRRDVSGLRKNGEEIPLEVSISRQSVRGRMILTAMVRDVGERRRFEQEISVQREELGKNEQRMRMALERGHIGVWEWNLETNDLELNATSRRIMGLLETGRLSANDVFERIHPDDLTDMRRAISHAIETGTDYNYEFRIQHGVNYRRVASMGAVVFDDKDEPKRMIGVHFDVTRRWQDEEKRKLLMNELNHRMANLMLVIQSVVTLSASRSPNIDAFKRSIQGRLSAVTQRHKFLVDGGWGATNLGALLRNELRPYAVKGTDALVIRGPQLMLSPDAAMTLGLVLHELATNAAKYGALSTPEGRLEIRWRIDAHGGEEHLIVGWTERGGPPVSPPTRRGFGSTVVERLLQDQSL